MKIYNPVHRSKFVWRELHNVWQKFDNVEAIRCALYHELEDDVPDSGDYNLGYFEGKQQKKKWLNSRADLKAMYTLYHGKTQISLWCDGKEPGDENLSSDEEQLYPSKKRRRTNKKDVGSEKEGELESIIFSTIEGKTNYSGPQLRLWARMVVAKTHDDLDDPPKVPMITGLKSKQKESLTEVFTSAAVAIAKAFSPSSENYNPTAQFSPSKKITLRMKNLDQLRQLQQLQEDGILSQEEFQSQKKIVLESLNNL